MNTTNAECYKIKIFLKFIFTYFIGKFQVQVGYRQDSDTLFNTCTKEADRLSLISYHQEPKDRNVKILAQHANLHPKTIKSKSQDKNDTHHHNRERHPYYRHKHHLL